MPNLKKKFSKVYDKYVEKIYRYIFLKVDSHETAEDLTSQVFAKTWNRIRKGQSSQDKEEGSRIKNLTAYIYQIARSEVANYHRERIKFQTVSTETVQIIDSNPNIEEKQELQREIERIKLALRELNDDHQNVIIWRYLDNLSYKEIGEIMGKPEGTIRVLVHRALKELRRVMEGL